MSFRHKKKPTLISESAVFRFGKVIFHLSLRGVEFAAVVFAFDHHGLAHLVEAGAETDADAVFERLIAFGAACVEIVGGEDG